MMFYQEKRNIISILSTILFISVYFSYLYQKLQAEGAAIADNLRFWGIVILIFITASIVIRIFFEILFTKLNTMATKGQDFPESKDEMDKQISNKVNGIGYNVVSIGFILSIISLVLKMSPFVMINTVFASFYIAEIIANICRLYYYRRGL